MTTLLVISPFVSWPLSQGSIVRTHYLVRELARKHTVYFAFRGGEGQESIPFVKGTLVNQSRLFSQLLNPSFLWALRRMVRREGIRVVVVSHLWSSLHGLLLKFLTGLPLVIDAHNVEYVRLRRMGSRAWFLAGCLEFVTCHLAERVVCVSEEDKALLIKKYRVNPKKIQPVLNGVDVQRFSERSCDIAATRKALGLDPDAPCILFFGTLAHRPNAQAADIILDELAPRLSRLRPDGKLVLVGLGAETYLQSRVRPVPSNVVFAGFAKDIVALIQCADLVIVPLTAGSGTRYKILESLACGRRVISTTIGAEGLDLSLLGDAVSICDDWGPFAARIAEQLSHPREVPIPSGFIAAHDWASIADKINMDNLQ